MTRAVVLSVLFGLVVAVYSRNLYLSNLDAPCMKCLCAVATGCNLTYGCQGGYCGPYKISRLYWEDAGKVVLPNDDPDRLGGAYEDCARSYTCAQRIVSGYFQKFGRDCNGDGVTDCDDFMMINFNGGWSCNQPLDRNEFGIAWLDKYSKCNIK